MLENPIKKKGKEKDSNNYKGQNYFINELENQERELNYYKGQNIYCKFFTSNMKQEFSNLHEIVMNIVKKLLLNELEIACWAIYLEELKWGKNKFSLEEYLLIIGLAAKVNFD